MTSLEPDGRDEATDDDSDVRVDGRSLRRERNRDAVIGALLAMLREGVVDPGGAEIADRAGVSHRSIFRYFDDLGDLVRTAIAQELAEALPLGMIENPGTGSLSDRIDALVGSRLRLFGSIQAVASVARARALTIPEITQELAVVSAMFRAKLREHLSPEFDRFPEATREYMLDAAQVLVSWDAYDMHRRLLGHDDDRIRASWATSLAALLET
jgi:AcrR family transcriptional regulator